MKIMHISIWAILLSLLFFSSCSKLDNYDGPNASISGVIKDSIGGALIEQDVENGSKIYYTEMGWANPQQQSMIFKETGEYRNNVFFSASYNFYFNETNFVRPDTLRGVHLNAGSNTLDFVVKPYIRFSNVSIAKSGNDVVATLTITPTVSNNVKEIVLFGHIDRVVGNSFKFQEKKQAINAASLNTPKTYTVTLTPQIGTDFTKQFAVGKTYYFRVGALIDVPNAKYNYAPAIQITL